MGEAGAVFNVCSRYRCGVVPSTEHCCLASPRTREKAGFNLRRQEGREKREIRARERKSNSKCNILARPASGR